MSLEQALAANTAAVLENTIAVSTLITLMACRADAPETTDAAAAAPKATRTKAEQKLDAAAKTTPKTETSDDAPQVEYSQIQALVPKIATTAEGTEMVKALFARFGVKRGPELKAEQYADFYADLVRVQAGEFDPRTAEV